jgi:hypothetical protein
MDGWRRRTPRCPLRLKVRREQLQGWLDGEGSRCSYSILQLYCFRRCVKRVHASSEPCTDMPAPEPPPTSIHKCTQTTPTHTHTQPITTQTSTGAARAGRGDHHRPALQPRPLGLRRGACVALCCAVCFAVLCCVLCCVLFRFCVGQCRCFVDDVCVLACTDYLVVLCVFVLNVLAPITHTSLHPHACMKRQPPPPHHQHHTPTHTYTTTNPGL